MEKFKCHRYFQEFETKFTPWCVTSGCTVTYVGDNVKKMIKVRDCGMRLGFLYYHTPSLFLHLFALWTITYPCTSFFYLSKPSYHLLLHQLPQKNTYLEQALFSILTVNVLQPTYRGGTKLNNKQTNRQCFLPKIATFAILDCYAQKGCKEDIHFWSRVR